MKKLFYFIFKNILINIDNLSKIKHTKQNISTYIIQNNIDMRHCRASSVLRLVHVDPEFSVW